MATLQNVNLYKINKVYITYAYLSSDHGKKLFIEAYMRSHYGVNRADANDEHVRACYVLDDIVVKLRIDDGDTEYLQLLCSDVVDFAISHYFDHVSMEKLLKLYREKHHHDYHFVYDNNDRVTSDCQFQKVVGLFYEFFENSECTD